MNKNLAKAIKSHNAGRLNEAETLYRKVLRDEPNNDLVLGNLAAMANQVGKPEMALALTEQALKANPRNATTYNNRGNAFSTLGRHEDAIQCYRHALHYMPKYADALHNIGAEFQKLGRNQEAFQALNESLKVRPDSPEAYNSLGLVLHAEGKFQEAVNAYRQALKLRPNFASAYNNLGNTLSVAGQMDSAIFSYQEAIRIKPNFFEAYNNLGNALSRTQRLGDAIAALKTALAINPNLPEARTSLVAYKQSACDWEGSEADDKAFIELARRKPGAIDPFFFLSQQSTPADQLLIGKAFAQRSAVPAAAVFKHTPDQAKRKIRIGYISGNFYNHPNVHLSVGMFEKHDRKKFEVFGYSYGQDDKSEQRKRVEKSFDHFVDLQGMTHLQAAERIKQDHIDILIDRQGYTTGHRLGILAYRPAPVQVNYLGYPGTMGAECLDYVIVDPFVVPSSQQPFFTEKLATLPECYQSTDDRAKIAATPTREQCGLPKDAFVFCCFNNTNKIRPFMFDIWMRLLQQVPGSVLWLLNKNKLVQANLEKEAKKRGIDPSRIICAPMAAHADHLARQACADLFLDTLPYNAHTTASDALWAGLPMVTCVGDTFAGRVGGSILQAIGLPELITTSLKDYEALALALAKDPGRLSAIRAQLVKNKATTSLFNTERYTHHLEDAYEQMFVLWRAGKAPEAITVSARKA